MKMLYQNQINKIKNFISVQPNIFIIVLASVYLFPSLFLYFVSEDIKFAVLFRDHLFFENLRNIWFPSGEFLNKGYLFRPIISSLNLIEYSLWGINPFGYHLTNALTHIFNGLLLYHFSFILLDNQRLSIISTAIFILHPILGHSIFWISGRTDMISLGFYLSSLIYIIHFIKKNELKLLIISQSFFLCAILSKEIAITIPLAQYLIIYWKIDKEGIENGLKQLISKVILGNILVLFLFFSYRYLIFNQSPFIIDDMYNIGGYSQLVLNTIKIISFLVVPFGHSLLETHLLDYKLYLIVLFVPICIKGLIFLYSNRIKYHTLIMVLLMLFISVIPLFKLTMRWYLYVPSSFFSILLAIIIIKSKARSKILYSGILLYLGLFMAGCMINYNTWINNAKTSKILVDGLIKIIKTNSSAKTFIILNFPAKIHRAATFIDGFESFIDLNIDDKKRILRPVNVVHEANIKPTAVNVQNETFILNACEESSYFLLGSNEQRLGLRSLSPGDFIKMDSGTVTIQKVNEKGKPIRVALSLNDSLIDDDICYLYFDEHKQIYKVLNSL